MQKDDEVVAHRDKYVGSQAERSSKVAADAEANKVAKQLKGSKLSGNCLGLFILLARIEWKKLLLLHVWGQQNYRSHVTGHNSGELVPL
jgi:hypothetical protein